jgi:hypothetical protein
VRFVAIAALAATFWLLVATVRLVMSPPASPRIGLVTAEIEPAPRQIALTPPAVTASLSPATIMRYQGGGCGGVFFGPEDEPGHSPPRVRRLPRSVIVAGLNAIKPRVDACYEAYGVPGTALVNVRVGLDGALRSAKVTGKFARTPTGACVEAALLGARFPPSVAFVTSYAFQLR